MGTVYGYAGVRMECDLGLGIINRYCGTGVKKTEPVRQRLCQVITRNPRTSLAHNVFQVLHKLDVL